MLNYINLCCFTAVESTKCKFYPISISVLQMCGLQVHLDKYCGHKFLIQEVVIATDLRGVSLFPIRHYAKQALIPRYVDLK